MADTVPGPVPVRARAGADDRAKAGAAAAAGRRKPHGREGRRSGGKRSNGVRVARDGADGVLVQRGSVVAPADAGVVPSSAAPVTPSAAPVQGSDVAASTTTHRRRESSVRSVFDTPVLSVSEEAQRARIVPDSRANDADDDYEVRYPPMAPIAPAKAAQIGAYKFVPPPVAPGVPESAALLADPVADPTSRKLRSRRTRPVNPADQEWFDESDALSCSGNCGDEFCEPCQAYKYAQYQTRRSSRR